jgi:hypothetical protein
MAEGGELRQVEQIRFSEDDTEGQTEKINTQKTTSLCLENMTIGIWGRKTWAE